MNNIKITSEDIEAIKALGIALDETILSGDFKAVSNLFTEKTSLMGANMPAIIGRSGLLGFLESSGMTVSEHKITFIEIDGYNDLAYAICSFVETFTVKDSGTIREEGKILGVFRKQQDGSWLIDKWSWNSDLPLSE